MKRIYLWLIPLSFVWPLVYQAIFYARFQGLDSFGAMLQILPFGVLAAFILLYALDKSSSQLQKWLVVVGYLLASPFAFMGSLMGGLLDVYIVPALFGSLPLVAGTFLGYYVGKYLGRKPETN